MRPAEPALAEEVPAPGPRARVLGAAWREEDLPGDLYIPPDALEVFLEAFEGPLDLLLYLIRRQGFSILDVPIADITRQYLAYIEMMDTLRIELAAEYLLMAAILAEIKSRLLLPRPAAIEAEADDPRAELIRRLREYERYRAAAQRLDELPRCERDLHVTAVDVGAIAPRKVYPEVGLPELLLAFRDVLRRAEHGSRHPIPREPLSVRARMAAILDRLRAGAALPFSALPFSALFEAREGRAGAVVSLLAILEMSKEQLIDILQEEPLGPLRIGLRPAAVAA